MKGCIAATMTKAFFFLTLFILALASDHELRAPDAVIHKGNEEYHRSLQVTKDSVDPKLGTELTQLYQDYLHARNLDESYSSQVVEHVSVDITFKSVLDNERAKKVLRPAVPGIDFISCFQYMCSTRVPVSALKDISSIDAVQVVHSVKAVIDVDLVTTDGDRALAEGGSVISEGVKAMYVDVARSTYGVNGTGLLIGVASDSYNCKGGAAADIASGDLPSGANSIVIVADLNASECISLGGADVGRAMMQLIHDVAPGARLAFHTSFGGQAVFANGLLALAATGCDIIVGAARYVAEPMFQDGIIAQAVNQVVTQGIPYFAGTGSNARNSWDATSGFNAVNISGRVLHQFGNDTSGNPITRMSVTVPGDNIARQFSIQWNDPFKSSNGIVGAQSDLDIIAYLNNVQVIQSINRNIVGGDPFEFIGTFAAPVSITYEIEILRFAGPSPSYIKCVVSGGNVTFQFPTNLGTTYGHANAASAAGVGAAGYLETPAYGVTPPKIEPFSSVGGVPIFLAPDGSRLSSPEIRQQPRFTGPDGVANTFLGQQDGNGIWRFVGTSAAAAQVAAVAALMLQLKGGPRSLTPAQIYSTLQATAVDMDDPFTPGFDNGFDFGTGHGLVNAAAALQAFAPPTTPVTAPIAAPTPVASPVVDCTLTFDLFNALTDSKVDTLTNGMAVTNPPPCRWANIEAVVPCGDLDNTVTLELYQGTNRIRAATDSGFPYFLFGNRGRNIKRGKIPAGSYGIRAQVNGVWSPLTNFTLGGSCN